MPKRIEKFRELRGRMKAKGYSGQELAAAVGFSGCAMSTKLIGLKPFILPEIYRIMKVLEIPADQMHVYFPNEGESSAYLLQTLLTNCLEPLRAQVLAEKEPFPSWRLTAY